MYNTHRQGIIGGETLTYIMISFCAQLAHNWHETKLSSIPKYSTLFITSHRGKESYLAVSPPTQLVDKKCDLIHLFLQIQQFLGAQGHRTKSC